MPSPSKHAASAQRGGNKVELGFVSEPTQAQLDIMMAQLKIMRDVAPVEAAKSEPEDKETKSPGSAQLPSNPICGRKGAFKMFDFRRALAVVALGTIAGCGESQALATPAATNGIRATTSSGNCPALSGGTGILSDGDFSQAADPGDHFYDHSRGYAFAPDWKVSKGIVDFAGSTLWDLDGLCSVDTDGYMAGGIKTSAFALKRGASYTLSFVLSGNGACAPTVKTLKVSVGRQFTTYTWNTSGGNDVQNGDYATEAWKFNGAKGFSTLTLTSQDPKKSSCGPVVGGMAITKN
jgi:hypothetical protein